VKISDPSENRLMTVLFFNPNRTARAETVWNRFCGNYSHGSRPDRETGVCVGERSSCRFIMLRLGDLVFFYALSTISLSPAVVRDLRMALTQRKKRPVMPAGLRGTISGGGVRAPYDHLVSSWARVKPTSWQARVRFTNRSAGAQRLTIGPRLCPRIHLRSRRTSCNLQPATRVPRGRGNTRGCFGRPRRPVSAKWATHAHSHGFRPVRTACFVRESKQV
jgi:hypothetical protein